MISTVVVLVDDLFWKTKIDHAVKSAQAPATFVSDPAELAASTDAKTAVVFVDLSLRNDPFDAIAALKKSPKTKNVPVVGFFEHVRKDLKEKAEKAGCDEILPRSTFSQRLGDILMKYALPGGVRTESTDPELPEE